MDLDSVAVVRRWLLAIAKISTQSVSDVLSPNEVISLSSANTAAGAPDHSHPTLADRGKRPLIRSVPKVSLTTPLQATSYEEPRAKSWN